MRGAVLALLGFLGGAALAQEPAPIRVKLSQGAGAPLKSKPAEIFYLSENGDSSYAINAAVTGAKRLGFLDSAYAEHELLFGGALSKTDLKAKPTDLRSANLGLATDWTGLRSTRLEFHSAISYAAEEDRVRKTRGHSARLDLSIIELCPDPNFDTGERGVYLECYPYAGYFHRKISRTNTPLIVPRGSYGGAYIGFFVRASFGRVTDVAWWAPVTVELDSYYLKESQVSGGYVKDSYNYSTATLSYALYGPQPSKWKPRVSLVREVGTDRFNNRDKRTATKLAFQISYGL